MQNLYQTLPGLFLLIFSLFGTSLQAQNYNMDDVDGTTVRECDGFFFDSGGQNGDYSNREDFVVTFCADAASPGKAARLKFTELDLRLRDDLRFYDGPNTNSPFLQLVNRGDNNFVPFAVSATRENTSGCLTVEFSSRRILGRSEGAGWEAEIGCIDRCQTMLVELVSSTPAVMPADTGWIDACVGQEISFEGNGEFPQDGQFYTHIPEYYWDFGDGSPRVRGKNAKHTYTEPGGYVAQLTIIDQIGCVSVNNLDQRVRISPPPTFTVQDSPQFCAGDTLNLIGGINGTSTNALINANSTNASFEPRYTRADSIFLPDGVGVAYETSLTIGQFSPGQTLDDIDDLLGICINAEHSYMRDLQVSIECPNGRSVVLQNFENQKRKVIYLGVPIDNEASIEPGEGFEYCWTPDATNGTWIQFSTDNLQSGGTMPAGDYSSLVSLDSLLGCPLNGSWTITVEDFLKQDNGYIFDWNISFNPDLYPELEEFEPAIVDFGWSNQGGAANVEALLNSAGDNAYTFFIEDEFGCTYDTTITVQGLPPTHPDCYSCQELLTEIEDVTYCDEDPMSLEVGVANLDQTVKFDAIPNYTRINALGHPDNQPYESILNVNSIFPNVLNTLDDLVSVCIEIDAGNNEVSDLSVWLISPNGSRLELTSNNGTGRTGYQQTCFTPTATDVITGGTAPFTGEFLPEGPWDNLLGGEVNGDWKLRVSDNNGNRESSTLVNWSITFNARNDISYAWTPAVGLSCDDCPNPELINSGNVTDNYSITASDQYNCESTAEVAVTNISNIDVPSITCEVNDNKELVIGWNDPNSSNYEISLDNGINWFAPNDPNLHALNGLDRDEVVNISLRPILEDVPVICNIPVNDTVCIYVGCELELMLMASDLEVSCFDSEDGMVEFAWQDGLAPYQYVYNDNASNIAEESHRIDNIAAGEHRFVINDAEGCSDTIVFQITAPEALEMNAIVENPRCADDRNGTIELEVNGGTPDYAYSLDGILFDSKAVFAGLEAGTYEVIIKDKNECEFQQSITLSNPESIEVLINREDEEFIQMTYGDEMQLFASVINGQGILDYTWSSLDGDSTLSCITCPDPFINPIMTTYFELEVEDENGCKSSDRVQVRVERIFKHFVPNAFSPDENGINERLTVYSENDAVIKSFQVYDRWGGLVFSASDFAANDLMSGWDGRGRNGEIMPMSTYVWYSEVEYNDGTKKLFTGSTALMR